MENITPAFAHDLRNLLTVIVCSAEHLRDAVPAEGELDIEAIVEAVRCIDAMAGERGGCVPCDEALDLERAVEAVGVVWCPRVATRASLVVECDADTPRVRLARADFDRIVANLVANAFEAVDVGGLIRVRCHRREDGAAVIVEDNGHGIAPEAIERIFATGYTTRGSEGRGLGLSTVRALVEAAGGELRVESVVGAGARFTLSLPGADVGSRCA